MIWGDWDSWESDHDRDAEYEAEACRSWKRANVCHCGAPYCDVCGSDAPCDVCGEPLVPRQSLRHDEPSICDGCAEDMAPDLSDEGPGDE